MAKTWQQKQQEKERIKKESAGGAAEAPVSQPAPAVAPSPNAPDRTRLDNRLSPAQQARKPVTGASTIPHEIAGVPSAEQQKADSEKAAATAPAKTEAEKTNVTAASGDAAARVAPSAPGATVTTSEGTFTAAEWAEKNKKKPKE